MQPAPDSHSGLWGDLREAQGASCPPNLSKTAPRDKATRSENGTSEMAQAALGAGASCQQVRARQY